MHIRFYHPILLRWITCLHENESFNPVLLQDDAHEKTLLDSWLGHVKVVM